MKKTKEQRKDEAEKAYLAINIPAYKIYEEIKDPAWEAYRAIDIPAWNIYKAKYKEIDEEIDEEIVKEEEDVKNMTEKKTLQEILYILADVVEEQATRELSGTDWGNKNVKKINELIKKL